MAMLLLHQHATVTICHSRTRDLPAVTRQADILVAAVGRTAFVRPDMVKPGATVIDVGHQPRHRPRRGRVAVPAGVARGAPTSSKRGALVVGDVHPAVAEVAGALTPVPGGVGPLTIALLLRNTVTAAEAPSAVIRVALTGGIATGKSHVLAAFARRGVPTIDADRLAHDASPPARRAPRLSSSALRHQQSV